MCQSSFVRRNNVARVPHQSPIVPSLSLSELEKTILEFQARNFPYRRLPGREKKRIQMPYVLPNEDLAKKRRLS
jgi:hypothetical protein